MTTRLNALADRISGQAFGLTNYANLEADMNYLVVPGANIAALTGANALAITSQFHKVTVTGGSNIDNLTDALGAVAGQKVELVFTNRQVLRNQGSGTGNIRTLNGADYNAAPNELVVFEYDGTNWWLGRGKFFGYSSQFDIVSDLTLRTIFTQSIPGGVLGLNGALDLAIAADYFNNTSIAQSLTVEISYGATQLWTAVLGAIPKSANHRAFNLRALLSNEAATNAQRFTGHASMSKDAVAPDGIGLLANDDFVSGTIGGSSAEDSTVAQTLLVQVQHSASNASLELKGTVHVAYKP